MHLCVLFHLWLVWQLFAHSLLHSFIHSTHLYWLAAGWNPRGWERRHTAHQGFEGEAEKGGLPEQLQTPVWLWESSRRTPTGCWGGWGGEGAPQGVVRILFCWCRKRESESWLLRLHFAIQFLVLHCSGFSTRHSTQLGVCVFLGSETQLRKTGVVIYCHLWVAGEAGLCSQSWVCVLPLPPNICVTVHSCLPLCKTKFSPL